MFDCVTIGASIFGLLVTWRLRHTAVIAIEIDLQSSAVGRATKLKLSMQL